MERLNKISVMPNISIKQALKRMDEMGEKTILVTDNKNRLLGTVTDGDIRRWILKSKSLNAGITKVMNSRPFTLQEGYLKEEARKIMLEQTIECIPVVDGNRTLVSAVLWLDLFGNQNKIHKTIQAPVVIMAGGEGARLLPFTNILPKSLIPIDGKPVIELIIDRFKQCGCSEFYLSVNYKANILQAYFSNYKEKYKIKYIQEDKPLGTIGSLYMLKNKIKAPFFVSNCDILIEADYYDIFRFHKDNKNKLTLVVSLKHYTIPYGICNIKKSGILKGIKEKPEYDFLVNTGLYLMEPEVLGDIPKKKFYNTTDLIGDYIKGKEKIGVYPVSEKSWLDMGQWEELQSSIQRFRSI